MKSSSAKVKRGGAGSCVRAKEKPQWLAAFPFPYVQSSTLNSISPYTPMMSLVRSSTTGMVMSRMPMKSMMTPDLIIFVMGTYPEA